MDAPILVTAAEAAVWTGRPKGTIWRWASTSENRIDRYVTDKGTRYDLRQLPPLIDGVPASPPPRRKLAPV